MKNTIQYFSDEALRRGKRLSTEEIIVFVENFRILLAETKEPDKSILISLKVPSRLLSTFRLVANAEGKKYQTKLKELMKEYIRNFS